MNEIDKYLKEIGLTYEKLNEDEKSTFDVWAKVFEKETTVASITAFVAVQIKELTDALLRAIEDGDQNKIILFGGRLKNYKELLLLIEGPEKAKGAVREQLEQLISDKKK